MAFDLTNERDTFYRYYLWLCMSKGVTSYAAYTSMKINKGTISRWKQADERGEDILPSTKIAVKLADYFGIPIDSIMRKEDKYGFSRIEWGMMGDSFGRHRRLQQKDIKEFTQWSTLSEYDILNFETGKASIPLSELDVLAGVLGLTAEAVFSPWIDRVYAEAHIPLVSSTPPEVFSDEDIDFLITADDDSMKGAGLGKGNLAGIKSQVTADNNDIVYVNAGGKKVLRRYERVDNTVILRAENPNFPTMVFAGDEAKAIRIIGKATYFIIKVI